MHVATDTIGSPTSERRASDTPDRTRDVDLAAIGRNVEPATSPPATPRRVARAMSDERHARVRPTPADLVAVSALLIIVLEACSGLLPDDPIVWIITPLRLVLLVGLVAAFIAGFGHRTWATVFDLPVAALVLASLVSAWLVADDFAPWRWFVTVVGVFALTVAVSRRLSDLRESLGLIGLVGVAATSLAGIAQFSGQAATGFCRDPFTGSSDCLDPNALIRVTGTFANPNTLAAFLLLTLPFAAAFALAATRAVSQLVGWAIVGCGVLALALTFSRAPNLALLVAVAVFVLLRTPTTLRIRIGAAVAGVGVALFAIATLVAPDALGVRSDVWRAAVGAALRTPFGVGLQRGGAAIQERLEAPDEAFNHAHNLWLNAWLETGWAGLFAAIAITIVAAVAIVRMARDGAAGAPAIGAALAGFAVASSVDHPANTTRIAIALAVVLGVLAAAYGPPRTLRSLLGNTPSSPGRRDTLLDE